MHVGTAMTPLKTLAAAGAIAFALTTVADSAFARPGGRRRARWWLSRRWGLSRRWALSRRSSSLLPWLHWLLGWGLLGPGLLGCRLLARLLGCGYWPGYWGPGWGYYGAPAVAYTPFVTQERVWVESDAAGATPPPAAAPAPNPNTQQWWYWCASSRGYYPYVSSCAEGWQRVAPQPTPSTQ